MARGNTRNLQWGKGTRIKTSNRKPLATEGSNGDIVVAKTSGGSKIYAKVGGTWLSTRLDEDYKTDSSKVDQVKMHYIKYKMTSGQTSQNIYLPDTIAPGSVIHVTFFANHSGNLWHVYEWKDDSNASGNHFTQTLTTAALNTGTATVVFGPVPFAGLLKTMYTSVSGDPGADTTLTPTVLGESAAAALTIANGTSANGVDTVAYTSNNSVGAGDIITVASNNGASNAVTARVTIAVEEDTHSKVKNRVLYDRGNHRIQVDNMGSQIDDGKWSRILIFYV